MSSTGAEMSIDSVLLPQCLEWNLPEKSSLKVIQIHGALEKIKKDIVQVRCLPLNLVQTSACVLSHLSCVQFFATLWTVRPGSSVRGIFQARILGWVAMPSSRGSNPHFLCLLHWQVGSLPLVTPEKPFVALLKLN